MPWRENLHHFVLLHYKMIHLMKSKCKYDISFYTTYLWTLCVPRDTNVESYLSLTQSLKTT